MIMVGVFAQSFNKIKSWIAWSWTYLLLVWVFLVVFTVYMLRGPLRLGENFNQGNSFER